KLKINWLFLLAFTAVSVVGIFIGTYLSNFIDGKKLKKSFGWFVLIMGCYIIYKELTH
ncbi:MAG: TSUP family transporter, partial [Xanthomarina gelatinilytica]|nr:TSUP family transporter [Xanthomarina gelatinilytica]